MRNRIKTTSTYFDRSCKISGGLFPRTLWMHRLFAFVCWSKTAPSQHKAPIPPTHPPTHCYSNSSPFPDPWNQSTEQTQLEKTRKFLCIVAPPNLKCTLGSSSRLWGVQRPAIDAAQQLKEPQSAALIFFVLPKHTLAFQKPSSKVEVRAFTQPSTRAQPVLHRLPQFVWQIVVYDSCFLMLFTLSWSHPTECIRGFMNHGIIAQCHWLEDMH